MAELSLAFAVVLSVLASVAFAAAAVLQHEAVTHQTRQEQPTGLLSGKFLAELIRRPRWWIGFGLSGLGAILNLAALSGAPVAVAQPITALSVPLAVLMGRARSRTRTGVGPALWGLILAAMAGVSGFVVLAARHSESHPPDIGSLLVVAVVVAVLIAALVVAAHHGPGWLRSLSWTVAAATAYGLAAVVVKAIFTQLETGVGLTAPTVWGPALLLVMAYPLAAYLLQHGFISGAPAVVVGGLTVTDPIVSVVIGALLLGEVAGLDAPVVVAMSACAVVAVGAVLLLSRHHPDVQRVRAEQVRSVGAAADVPDERKPG